MTERKSWTPRIDVLFVFFSVLVIVLAKSPPPTPMQIVRIATVTGQTQTYSLAINDPRLRKLHRRVETYGQSKPAAALGKARWQAETAAFYAERTLLDQAKFVAGNSEASSSDVPAVMAVSYISPVDSAPIKRNLVEYWSEFGQRSEQSIADIEQKWLEKQNSLGPAPVSFGETVPGLISGGTIYVATILAIFVTALMTFWRAISPARVWNTVVAGVEASRASSSEVAIVVPAAYVRLHQPVSVHLRRLAYVGLLATAVLSF